MIKKLLKILASTTTIWVVLAIISANQLYHQYKCYQYNQSMVNYVNLVEEIYCSKFEIQTEIIETALNLNEELQKIIQTFLEVYSK